MPGPVRPCTSVGQPGTNVVLPTPIPNNVLVTIMGYTQSAATLTVQVLNSSGAVMAQLSGTGTSSVPMTNSGSAIATFQSGSGTYSVKVTSNTGETARVILQYTSLSYGTTTYAGTYVFIAEDSPSTGDCDFNDCTVFLSWNLFIG